MSKTTTFTRPAQVTVTEDGSWLLQLLAAAMTLAVLGAVVWFAITYALILGAGMATGCVLIAAGVWYLHRRFALVAYNPRRLRARTLWAKAVVLPRRTARKPAVGAARATAIGTPEPVRAPYVITDAIPQQRKNS